MNKYELIYIVDTALEEESRKGLIERFNGIIAANGGEVVKVEEWGKRRLAYAIDYKTEGYYVYVAFNAAPELPRELSRNLGINENVIRSQIVRILEKKSSVKPRPVRVAPAAPAEEAAQAAPVEQAAPAQAAAPVEQAAPVQEAAPVEEAAPAEAAAPETAE